MRLIFAPRGSLDYDDDPYSTIARRVRSMQMKDRAARKNDSRIFDSAVTLPSSSSSAALLKHRELHAGIAGALCAS